VLALCVWAALNHPAAAEALGVPVGTVRSRLSQARRRLEKQAQKNLDQDTEPAAAQRQPTGDRHEAVPPSGENGTGPW
jgi:RNA polymerase sigma-70 factor, ECF subfamily